ncbi:aminotransferase class V-fold PLP-dependent enzyme [Mesorhizobium erdmanii]|uniref:aminotransferase class V-fold PLP-dependent enzyme n=1 Tax=Mesorhizobium erdmanii TaxID=1777866 RepID=UPI00041A5470|nr:aminotransferase class V-fold PLP-dependent enzyme [Mesorhizobium erdmanii]
MNQTVATESPPSFLDAIRKDFPATSEFIYMDVANQGLISRAVRDSINEHLNNRLVGINDELHQLAKVEETRELFARFIGAQTNEIALTKNASEGINIIANAFAWKEGDNIILCPKLEHANNILPWLQLKARQGVEVRTIEPLNGQIDVEALGKAIDSRTRVVTIATVTMVPGFRTEVSAIARLCNQKGVFLLADATQSVGILATDVRDLGIDGLAVSTVKGLMGLYGSGFLYCRRQWADRLLPAYLARFSVDLGEALESAPVSDTFTLRPGATRFDIGHYNFPGLIAVTASIRQLSAVGMERIERHVTGLAARLATGLHGLGMPVCGGLLRPGSSSIVAVGDMSLLGGQSSHQLDVASLRDHLAQHKIIASARRGVLRFSLHLYNTADEVDQVIDIAKGWLTRPA